MPHNEQQHKPTDADDRQPVGATTQQSTQWDMYWSEEQWAAMEAMAASIGNWSAVITAMEAFQRLAAAFAMDGLVAQALAAAASSLETETGIDQPLNRRERRAASRMARQGRLFSRDKMRKPVPYD